MRAHSTRIFFDKREGRRIPVRTKKLRYSRMIFKSVVALFQTLFPPCSRFLQVGIWVSHSGMDFFLDLYNALNVLFPRGAPSPARLDSSKTPSY